jgi:hypothetical protein
MVDSHRAGTIMAPSGKGLYCALEMSFVIHDIFKEMTNFIAAYDSTTVHLMSFYSRFCVALMNRFNGKQTVFLQKVAS